MAYSYVQIFLQILAFVLVIPKNASGYTKENNLMEKLAENVWNLDGHAKALFTAQICTIANEKLEGGQMTTELEQLKMDLSEYCGSQNDPVKKGEKLEKMRKNVKKLLGSGDWVKKMRKSLDSARKEFEANQNDENIIMALKQEEEILKKIKQGMPSKGENIPKWFRSGLANALKMGNNGQLSIQNVFGLIETLFNKIFGDNGFAVKILLGTQGQGNGHHDQHNRSSAHGQFDFLRVKRAFDFPDFFSGVRGALLLLLLLMMYGPAFVVLVIMCFILWVLQYSWY